MCCGVAATGGEVAPSPGNPCFGTIHSPFTRSTVLVPAYRGRIDLLTESTALSVSATVGGDKPCSAGR